ncbi:MAG: sigma-54 interaction domain-containing protein [Bryobacteraceae bacterium]
MSAAAANYQPAQRLIGESAAIRRIREQIPRYATSRSPVLLLGETGVGKEVVARAIHDANPAGHFVPIDCGSMVGSLMETELFGHAKGAFTSAGESRKGLIELANGGTAFFDEIGDLPLDMQVKLLRVLQEREYRPVGSTTRYKVDIRVIAATHRNLAREVERSTFREDLYYRLNVIRVVIPPLRERKEDILVLTEHFLRVQGARHTVTPELSRALVAYEWPGNVRELFNCVQRMTTFSTGGSLEVEDLPTTVHNRISHAERELQGLAMGMAAGVAGGTALGSMPVSQAGIVTLAEMEKRHIREVLKYTKGDRTLSAHLLGIGRTTLYRKVKEYDIPE